ncbi:HEAT repeat domain-containing protein [Streptomyces sp. NPDC051286]|uniref:HEAT repeat domain-containing protein n=1 Tax=Streptomyces sp. NPDC051286 TaxID=3365647 RepID=UPI00378B927E
MTDTRNLFEALCEGEDAVVRLLRAGVPVESVDENGATALYLAAVSDQPVVVRLLLAAGADPDRACGPEAGDLPICGAAGTAVLGPGHHGDPVALPEVLRHARNPERVVRRAVTLALLDLVSGDHAEGVEVLVRLSRDTDAEVRDWATTALAALDTDTPVLRAALAERLDDADPDTVAEAVQGLARRQDPRAVPVLERLLQEAEPDGYARAVAVDAVACVADGPVRERLERMCPRLP